MKKISKKSEKRFSSVVYGCNSKILWYLYSEGKRYIEIEKFCKKYNFSSTTICKGLKKLLELELVYKDEEEKRYYLTEKGKKIIKLIKELENTFKSDKNGLENK